MIIFWLIFIFVLFLCYGSFLNVLAYRLISGDSLLIPNSFCPKCKTNIAWYDLIPVLSWITLKGKCRSCKAQISYLYPLIEFLTALLFLLLFIKIPPRFWIGYGTLLSGLIITIRTDIETMLIPRVATLVIIPFAFLFSIFGFIPINIYQSILGAIFGYFILWFINKIFYTLKKQQGIGEGDFDLMAMIGSFTGISGVWVTLILSSILTSIVGLTLISMGKISKNTRIPFGPFIALGAIIYIFSIYLNYDLFKILFF